MDSLDNYQDPIKIGIFERRGINDGWLSIGKKFNLANVSFKKGGQFQLLIKARNSKYNLPVEFKIELIPADRNFL